MEDNMRKVYMDGATTTYINNEVLSEMAPVMNTVYGDYSKPYSRGREVKEYVDNARKRVAAGINANAEEIYWTSGGTESNNLAILGLARANSDKGKHVIVSKIEDSSILYACKQLEKEGFKVSYIGCDNDGIVSLSQLMDAIRQDTILVSIQVANGEVGTIQNLNAIARTVKEKDIVFHCDATYAIGNIPLDVKTIPIDSMTISSHKIYGPAGIGALYVKRDVKIEPIILGDDQENGVRAGMQNVADMVGFGKAVELATRDVTINARKTRLIRDYFVKSVLERIDNVSLNGHQYQRVSNIANLSFECCDNECLQAMLDSYGINANVSGTPMRPSTVLKAMGRKPEQVRNAVRFSISKNSTKEDMDYVVEKLVTIVKKLREISPLRKSMKEAK